MLDFYDQTIIPAYLAKKKTNNHIVGVTMDDLFSYHHGKTGEMLNRDQVRKQYLPVIERAGLINYEKDPNDKRQMVITPLIGNLNINDPQKGE